MDLKFHPSAPEDHVEVVIRMCQLQQDGKLNPSESGLADSCKKGVGSAKWPTLTGGMMRWALKIIAKNDNPSESPAVTPSLNVGRVFEVFAFALNKLKRPKVTFHTRTIGSVRFAYMTKSTRTKYPDEVHVSDTEYGGPYYGRIDKDGAFHEGRDCSDKVISFLRQFAKDPQGWGATYGLKTGHCCFCNKKLGEGVDKSSLSVGYGKTCAKNWGMHWPKVAELREWKEKYGVK